MAEGIRCAARIQIRQLPGPCFSLSHMVFPSLKPYRLCRWVESNCRWMEPNCPLDKDRPFWSGFMQVVHVEQHSAVVSFQYLPIILTLTAYIQQFGLFSNWVKLGGFHITMNGLDATGYIMTGFGFRTASERNLCDKHYSTHHVWPVTTVHAGPAFSSLQPSTTSLPQPPAP